jgi:hypothetical protein
MKDQQNNSKTLIIGVEGYNITVMIQHHCWTKLPAKMSEMIIDRTLTKSIPCL